MITKSNKQKIIEWVWRVSGILTYIKAPSKLIIDLNRATWDEELRDIPELSEKDFNFFKNYYETWGNWSSYTLRGKLYKGEIFGNLASLLKYGDLDYINDKILRIRK